MLAQCSIALGCIRPARGDASQQGARAHLYFLPILEGHPGWHIAQGHSQALPARHQPQLQ